MLFYLSVATAIVAILIVGIPFVVGKGGALQAASSVNSVERLEKIKEAILKRFLEDEKAFENNQISKSVWKNRQQYLTNRYVDTARRLDFLHYLSEKENESVQEKGGNQ